MRPAAGVLAGALALAAWAGAGAGAALANDASRAARGLVAAYNGGAGLPALFSPEALAVRDAAAIEGWRARTLPALGRLVSIRYARAFGPGQHVYLAEFEAGPRDLYLALDRRGLISGLMLCEEGLTPLSRPEHLPLCSGP
jgi:hypothetical protein